MWVGVKNTSEWKQNWNIYRTLSYIVMQMYILIAHNKFVVVRNKIPTWMSKHYDYYDADRLEIMYNWGHVFMPSAIFDLNINYKYNIKHRWYTQTHTQFYSKLGAIFHQAPQRLYNFLREILRNIIIDNYTLVTCLLLNYVRYKIWQVLKYTMLVYGFCRLFFFVTCVVRK